VEITVVRGIKIWWSIIWRSIILGGPAMGIIMAFAMKMLNFPKPGDDPKAFNPAATSGAGFKFFLIWCLMMVLMIFVHGLAVRWALKTKWSDFKLVAVPPEENK